MANPVITNEITQEAPQKATAEQGWGPCDWGSSATTGCEGCNGECGIVLLPCIVCLAVGCCWSRGCKELEKDKKSVAGWIYIIMGTLAILLIIGFFVYPFHTEPNLPSKDLYKTTRMPSHNDVRFAQHNSTEQEIKQNIVKSFYDTNNRH